MSLSLIISSSWAAAEWRDCLDNPGVASHGHGKAGGRSFWIP